MIPTQRSQRAIVLVTVVVMIVGIGGPLTVAAQETSANNTTGVTTPESTPIATSGDGENASSQIAVREYNDEGEPVGCVAVQPFGDGTQTVEKFYGYRNEPDLSSVGSRHLQYTDTSQIMFYSGKEGLSIVVIHDRYGDDTPGGDANMTFTGLPEGEWVVRDDSAKANFSADRFSVSSSSADIHWKWGHSRTDGAAFRTSSRTFDAVRVIPEFNKSEKNIRAWGLRSADQDSLIQLDMSRNISISTDSCPSATRSAGDATTSSTPTISLGSDPSSGASNQSGNNTNGSANSIVGQPQSFVVTELAVDRSTTSVRQPVNITATIENQDNQAHTRTILFRTSENSTTERTIALNPGERQFVQFQHSYQEAGTYTLRAGAATTTIKVVASESGPGFGVLPAALAVLISALLIRKRISNQNEGNDGG